MFHVEHGIIRVLSLEREIMELFYPVDTVIGNNDYVTRLPRNEVRELQDNLNCNLSDWDDWLDEEYVSDMMREIDETEFLEEI